MTKGYTFLLFLLISIPALADTNECTINTFSITGNAELSLTPTIVKVTISGKGEGLTASSALSKLNVQINSLLKTVTSLNIPAGNYSTTAINVNQVLNYSSDPVKIVGS